MLAWEKSPTTLMAERVSAMLPVLVKVTDCAALVKPDNKAGKLSEAGDKLTQGPIPVPVRLTVCVLPVTPPLLSMMVTAPVSEPGARGEKVTVRVQRVPAATLFPQLLVSLKLALVAMLVMLSAAAPVLLKVTCCDTLCVPRFWLPNARLDGETPATATTPIPVIFKVWGLAQPLSVMVTVPGSVPTLLGVRVTSMVQVPRDGTEPPA